MVLFFSRCLMCVVCIRNYFWLQFFPPNYEQSINKENSITQCIIIDLLFLLFLGFNYFALNPIFETIDLIYIFESTRFCFPFLFFFHSLFSKYINNIAWYCTLGKWLRWWWIVYFIVDLRMLFFFYFISFILESNWIFRRYVLFH